MKHGNKYGHIFALLLSHAVCISLYVGMLLVLSDDPRLYEKLAFIRDYRHLFGWLPSVQPEWRRVLVDVLYSTKLVPIQLLLLYLLAQISIYRGLLTMAAYSYGEKSVVPRSFFSLVSGCIVIFPALGILSTVTGILLAHELSFQESKYIVFGPTGLGVIGQVFALTVESVFKGVAEYE